uniref:RING-type E3 ubiquitin transferase n=1 Tax=Anas platyrhynchos platyrhynchos TaxID=8840 RepID=A0A493U0J6_ANAPP
MDCDQHVESMASVLDKRCPICLDTWSNAGYVLPCLHRFCFKCIQRWAERKPECPLCKGRVTSIICRPPRSGRSGRYMKRTCCYREGHGQAAVMISQISMKFYKKCRVVHLQRNNIRC